MPSIDERLHQRFDRWWTTDGQPTDHDTILDTLERLGTLHAQGVLTDAEFMAKKQELLARL